MTRHDHERIADILDACDEVSAVVALSDAPGCPPWVLNRALERLLEVIGEAANSLSDQTRHSHPGVPWRDIARLRIVLAHHYQRVDADQVWAIAEREIPRLADSLRGGAEPPL